MRRTSSLAILLLILLIFSIGLLTSHQIPEDYHKEPCADNFRLQRNIGIVINCDSYEFMRLALEPQEIFEPQSIRQPRPGLIYIASGLTKILKPLGDFLTDTVVSLRSKTIQDWTAGYLPPYIAYITLNFGILLATLSLFIWLVTSQGPDGLIPILIGSILIVNDVSKTFLFSPHTALMILFLPLFCMGSILGILKRRWYEFPQLILLAIVAGIGQLVYPGFVIFIPCVIAAGWVKTRQSETDRRWWVFGVKSLIAVILFAIPYLLWIVRVVRESGGFHFTVIEDFGQLIWMGEALGDGTILITLGTHLIELLQGSLGYLVFILLYMSIFSLLAAKNPIRFLFDQMKTTPIRAAVFISLLFLVFFASVGLTKPRVAISIAIPFVVAASISLSEATQNLPAGRNRLGQFLAISLTLALLIYEIAKVGPFS